MKKILPVLLPILLTSIIFFLPIFLRPEILLERNNDLSEFFWPIIYFIKKELLTNHELPLWNSQILGGTPLLPDPQSQLFYLPNLIFLALPINLGFVFSLFLHVFFAGIGMYLLSRYGFKFSRNTSIFTALLYLTTPKIAGYLEAGHYGLVCFMAWIPIVLLSLIKITEESNVKWSILFAISLAGCFFTHSLSFGIAAIASAIFFVYKFFENKFNYKHFLYFFLGAVLTFGLIAISFLPQITWQKETTRHLLLQKPDVYPKWNSILEPLKEIVFPYKNIYSIDSEKWITFGLIPLAFAFLGFLKLKKEKKFYLILLLLPILLITLNNASPIYSLLIKQDWYKLLRVTTRFWFISILIVTYLSGYFVEKIGKGKFKFSLLTIFALLAIIESIGLSWTYFKRPINNPQFAPKEVYGFLSKDKDRFRVFCLTRCLSQKESAIYNLELLDGYSTLQQNNFYKQSWQFVQSYWDYYSLSFPPMGLYLFEEIKPHAESLGSYNVKYVISPYTVNDSNFKFIKKIDRYYIYSNNQFLPRAYLLNEKDNSKRELEISIYKPNHIQLKIINNNGKIILSEPFSKGWKGILNEKEQVNISETTDGLMSLNNKNDYSLIDLHYSPDLSNTGLKITLLCFIAIVIYITKEKFQFNEIEKEKKKINKALLKYILAIAYITVTISLIYLIRIIFTNSPLEYREGGVLSSTYLLKNMINPYSLRYMPGYTNVYGIIYNLFCLLPVRLFGLNFTSHRIISAIFIFMSSYIVYAITNLKTKSKIFAIFAFCLFFTQIINGYEILARPDSLGLFFFLLTFWIPIKNNFSNKSITLALCCGILSFLTKPYYLLGIFYLLIYLLIYKDRKKSIIFSLLFTILFFVLLLILNKYFESYLTNTVFSHIEAAGKDKLHLIRQIKQFVLWNFSFITIEIIYLFKSIRETFEKIKSKNMGIDLVAFTLLASSLFVLLKMGLHNGNYMTYFTQLITPFLILDSLYKLCHLKPTLIKSVMYLLIILNTIFWTYQILFLNLKYKNNVEYWLHWENILNNKTTVYNSPLITHLLIENNLEIINNGQSQFYSDGLILNTTFNPKTNAWKEYEDFKKHISENVINGKFELITITKNEFFYINRNDLQSNYHLKEINYVNLFNDYWPTEVWVKK